jgi:hypothetical protein
MEARTGRSAVFVRYTLHAPSVKSAVTFTKRLVLHARCATETASVIGDALCALTCARVAPEPGVAVGVAGVGPRFIINGALTYTHTFFHCYTSRRIAATFFTILAAMIVVNAGSAAAVIVTVCGSLA